MANDPYEDFARRLCAAAISYRLGNRSIDYTLKSHVGDGPVGDYWLELARKIDHDLADGVSNAIGDPSTRN